MRLSSAFAIPIACAALCLLPAGAVAQPAPNVLLILVDDLGLEHVGFYGVGSEPLPTPRLDQLAAEGLVFRHAWSHPVCSPTRAAIQTGRHAFRTGVGSAVQDDSIPGLRLDEVTVAEVLKDAPEQYATAVFGKWHLGLGDDEGDLDAPNDQGYDRFEGTRGNLLGEDYFEYTKITDGEESSEQGYITSDTVDWAASWIADAPEPWFAYVALHAPHSPVHWPPEELHSQDTGQDGNLPKYRAMAEAADTEIGRLLDTIDTSNLVVIFASDNGSPNAVTLPPFVDGRVKHTIFEGGVRVPLVIWGAGVPSGEVAAPVTLADLFATIAEIGGGPLPGVELDSVSLVPYFADPGRSSLREFAYTEKFSPNGNGPYDDWLQTARDERYKLLTNGTVEGLIDLQTDPYETFNLLSRQLDDEEEQAYNALWGHIEDLTGAEQCDLKPPGEPCIFDWECCSGECSGLFFGTCE